ncbi:MAG: hypothetical protein PVJ39_10495 [Gammaproteobacteria bacterium]|jgi:hypothetical protein
MQARYIKPTFSSALLAIGLSLATNIALADDNNPLTGCYSVEHGDFGVARGNNAADIVGTYRMLLVPEHAGEDDHDASQRKYFRNKEQRAVFLTGPMKGTPTMRTATGAYTRHVLGTSKRIGTLTSGDNDPDVFVANSGSCFGSDGIPLLIDATETMHFSGGTGIFSGLVSGTIEWHGISNSCDDPNNRVADYQLVEGMLCFE